MRISPLLLALSLLAPAAAAPPGLERDTFHTGQLSKAQPWLGADGAYSCALTPQRKLWLFSDTLVGRVGKMSMPHNSLALEEGGKMRFVSRQIFTPPGSNKNWYWVYQPVADSVGGADVFLGEFTAVGKGAFNFRFVRTWLAHLSFTPGGEPAVSGYRALRKWPGAVNFGAATLVFEGQMYIYGTEDRGGFDKRLLLARAPLASWRKDSEWRYQNGQNFSAESFRPILAGPGGPKGGIAPLAVSNELSVFLRDGHVHLVTQVANDILFYVAEKPWGPFRLENRVPIEEPGKGVITYNAKAHPEFARDGKILLTYNRNAMPPSILDKHPELYRPQFLWYQP